VFQALLEFSRTAEWLKVFHEKLNKKTLTLGTDLWQQAQRTFFPRRRAKIQELVLRHFGHFLDTIDGNYIFNKLNLMECGEILSDRGVSIELLGGGRWQLIINLLIFLPPL